MSKPTKRVITDHLTRAGTTEKQAKRWGKFLHGLDWSIINPLVRMAIDAHIHPALVAGMTARSTRDENIRATLQAHLEAKAEALNEGTASAGTTLTG